MPNTYTFVRDGVPETVDEEAWGWGVVYKDGTELRQFEADGSFHQFKEINQGEVSMFVMYKIADPDQRYDMLITEKDIQIFHFYRNFMFNVMTPGENKVRVYVFGWKSGDACCYFYILPNGRLMTSPMGEGIDLSVAVQANAE